MGRDPAQPLWAVVLGPLENPVSGSHHGRKSLVDVLEPSGEAPGAEGAKGSESGAGGREEGPFSQHHCPAAQLRPRQPSSATVSPVGGRECVSEHLAPPAVRTLPSRPISVSLHPGCWVLSCMTGVGSG